MSASNVRTISTQGGEPTPAQLRALIEQASDGIFVANEEGRYTFVNEAGCRLLGYARDELIGKTIFDLIPREDVDRLLNLKTHLMTGASDVSDWKLRHKNGEWLPVEVSAKIFPDGQWQGIVRDISERVAHQAERDALFQQLRTHERWLQAVLDALPLGVVLYRMAGGTFYNRRAEEIFGLMLVATAGSEQYSNRIFYRDGRPVPHSELVSTRVMRDEQTIVGEEFLIERPDGSRIPILGSAAPIRDDTGRMIGGVGLFQDMSDRMRAEEIIREEQRLLKAVFEILPVGVWIADRSGRIVNNNPAGERIWHGARYVAVAEFDQYKGWWVDTGKPIAAEEWALARALKGATSHGELVRIQCFDGSFKTIINSAAPLRDEQGAITGAIVVNEDITALHETQEKLRTSERLFRTVFELVPVGLWIADGNGQITLSNRAADSIWQGMHYVGPTEYGKYKGWWVDSGKAIAPDEWGLSRAVRYGETSHSELIRIQCFDGSFKTVINWAAPIHSDVGEITGAIAVNEDVTSLQQTQEQLRAAVRDRENILATVTHDLRSPLAALKLTATAAEQVARTIPGAEKICELASSMHETARQMFGLVDDLLAVTVSKGCHSMLKLAPLAANALIAKAIDAARPLFAQRTLGLEVRVVDQLPILNVDADRILRVLANLLDNALKFTIPPGRVLLTAESVASGVRFSVANSGEALGSDELEGMFQPFWQAERDDRRGVGLGLAICRSIVEAHGGSIWAEPAQGERVRVCFILPRAPVGRVPIKD